jgi:hypothetical protein
MYGKGEKFPDTSPSVMDPGRELRDNIEKYGELALIASGALPVAGALGSKVASLLKNARLLGGKSGAIPIKEFSRNASLFTSEDSTPLFHATETPWKGDTPNPGTWFSKDPPTTGNPFARESGAVRAYTIPKDTPMSGPISRGRDFSSTLSSATSPVVIVDDGKGGLSYVVKDPSILKRLEVKRPPQPTPTAGSPKSQVGAITPSDEIKAIYPDRKLPTINEVPEDLPISTAFWWNKKTGDLADLGQGGIHEQLKRDKFLQSTLGLKPGEVTDSSWPEHLIPLRTSQHEPGIIQHIETPANIDKSEIDALRKALDNEGYYFAPNSTLYTDNLGTSWLDSPKGNIPSNYADGGSVMDGPTTSDLVSSAGHELVSSGLEALKDPTTILSLLGGPAGLAAALMGSSDAEANPLAGTNRAALLARLAAKLQGAESPQEAKLAKSLIDRYKGVNLQPADSAWLQRNALLEKGAPQPNIDAAKAQLHLNFAQGGLARLAGGGNDFKPLSRGKGHDYSESVMDETGNPTMAKANDVLQMLANIPGIELAPLKAGGRVIPPGTETATIGTRGYTTDEWSKLLEEATQ